MKGAIIGDIVGSVYEWDNIKTKDFPLFREDCFFTDDTVMTVAVGEALMNCLTRYKRPCLTPSPLQILAWTMRDYGRRYPHRGYGGRFLDWIYDADPQPYNSWGNGAPMRCSAAGWLATHMDGAEALGALTALPTHNHPEGIRAAALTAELIYLARTRRNMDALWTIAEEAYNIPKLDDVRDTYTFTESSQGTMPVALAAFFESTSFEDAIRNAISVGGDSDTIAAITGSIAEAYYGVPDELWDKAATYLDDHLLACVNRFYDYIKESNQPILQGGSQMKKIQWSDLRYNGEEVELNCGYPVGHVPISSLLKRIDDLTAELSTETELHHKFEKLALQNALDYDTLSEQLANQTERAQRAERLLEKAVKYIPQKCSTCAALAACLRGKPFTPAEALSKYVCEKWKWHGFKKEVVR